ncbi:hypothetical protein ACFUGD_02785 [Streptomyces sp. NPDC057217]|uniref:hypothetical protein n=1 Tax=Streptomyces sp. NPDC057217 TaxID=3346054 RepID=UPI0036381475
MTATFETPAVGLPTRPTAVTKPFPPHGSIHRAMGDRRIGMPRCSCQPCRTAERRYSKRRVYLAAVGTPILIDAAPARAHLHALKKAGMAYTDIARQNGIPRRTITSIAGGTYKRIRSATAAAILAIQPGAASDRASVPAFGVARRIQALMAAGHPFKAILAATGLHHSSVSSILNGHQDTVRAELAARVEEAYRRLASSRGTSARSLRRAERCGWRDPLWWEDMGHIDDPDFDPATAERELNRDELGALRRQEIEHLSSYGYEPEVIAERLELHISTVRAVIQELRTGERRVRKAVA